MHQSELLMVIIELYFQQNYDRSAEAAGEGARVSVDTLVVRGS